jgi:hypothetical protein
VRSRLALAAMLFGTSLAGTSLAASEADTHVDVQFVILKTPTTGVRLKTDSVTGGTAMLACGRFTVDWGNNSLKSDNGQLLVNGQPYDAPANRAAAALSIVSAPRVRAQFGTSVQIKTGDAEAAQYFERDPDGRFSLKTVPVTPELDLEVTLTRGRSSEAVGGALNYHLVQLGKRAPIPGVSLEVGAPEFRELSARGAEVQTRLGDWCLIRLGDGSGASLSSGLALVMRPTLAR